MIVEYIRYRILPAKQAGFIAADRQAAEHLAHSEHCLGYELSQCEEEPARFILRIEWTSTVDHLQGFRSSEEFRAFLPLVRPFLEDIEEMQHYQLTDVVSADRRSG